MTAQRFLTHPLGIVAAAVMCTALWGSAFPVIKLSYAALDIRPEETGEQLVFAGYRFFLAASMILLAFACLRQPIRLTKANAWPLLRIGVFQTFLQYVLFYIGLSHTSGIQGSVISGTTSFFQMLFAHFMYADDKLNGRKSIGLLIGFAGVVVVNLSQGALELRFGLGEVCVLLAMAAAGLGNLYARNGTARMHVAYLTGYQMLFGATGLLLAGATAAGWAPFEFTPAAAGMLAYLAFLSAAVFVVWNAIMKYNSVGNVSMYLFLIPVFGVFLSSLMLGEAVHLFIVAGLALVTAGIVIVNRRKQRKEGVPSK
ncbi:DMT family transporter [Paenibacillus sp. TRM 82003]|nr:DMT family transporter [Paenibacillus sp. TRM 82003]